LTLIATNEQRPSEGARSAMAAQHAIPDLRRRPMVMLDGAAKIGNWTRI